MEHENDIIRQLFALGDLMDAVLPESYRADSVRDFIESRRQVEATHVVKALGFIPAFYVGCALIGFNNVDLFRDREGYKLSDTSGAMNNVENPLLYPYSHESVLLGKLQEGRYWDVTVRYYPRNDRVVLYYVKPYGPPAADSAGGLVPGSNRMWRTA